jgi:hypothetical protein
MEVRDGMEPEAMMDAGGEGRAKVFVMATWGRGARLLGEVAVRVEASRLING